MPAPKQLERSSRFGVGPRATVEDVAAALTPLLAELGRGVTQLTPEVIMEEDNANAEWARILTAVLMLHGDVRHREEAVVREATMEAQRMRATAIDCWCATTRLLNVTAHKDASRVALEVAPSQQECLRELTTTAHALKFHARELVDHYRRRLSSLGVSVLVEGDRPLHGRPLLESLRLIRALDGVFRAVDAPQNAEERARVVIAFEAGHDEASAGLSVTLHSSVAEGARRWVAPLVALEGVFEGDVMWAAELRDGGCVQLRYRTLRIAEMSAQHAAIDGDTHEVPRRVMVVDDERIIGAVIQRTLQRELGPECEVQVFDSAEAAIVALEKIDPQLVISDIHMPGMNGVEFYYAAVRLKPALSDRFVFVSGSHVPPQLQAPLRRGDVTYLQKPFRPNELVSTVRSQTLDG